MTLKKMLTSWGMSIIVLLTNYFGYVAGKYFFIKCEGRNSSRKDHNVYLQVTSKNELVAVKDREIASDFEIEEHDKKKHKFAIKFGTKYLPKPSDKQKQHSQRGH